MPSSNAGETSRTTLGMPALSETIETTTPSSRSHTGDTPSSNIDQFNQYPNRVRSVPTSVDQTSDNMPASNSEDNRDPGQDTDNPLPNREDVNAAQPGHTAEHYEPELRVSLEDPGFLEFMLSIGVSLTFVEILYGGIALSFELLDWMWCTDETCWWNPIMENGRRLNWALMNWLPVIFAYLCLPRYGQLKFSFRRVVVTGACLFGLFFPAYCALLLSKNFPGSTTGTQPQSFRGCDARVEPKQASLFATDIYHTQFARTKYNYSNYPIGSGLGPFYQSFDIEPFRNIQMNQTLCDRGFEGNNDLYGLGIRISLYLQWLSSFLANNFLPGTRQDLQKPYLIFSLAICLVTIISSFVKACVFSIEIEIMYWMYWGGYVCVFASAPCQVRLGSETKWIKLDWTTVTLFTTHALMIYHGVWFVWYAFDQVFSRMPCGTYHFFFLPILDPGEGFWIIRSCLTSLTLPLILLLPATFPFVGLLLASEVKYTIHHSATYQTLFPKPPVSDRDQPQTTEHNASLRDSLGLRVYLFITRRARAFREILRLPSHSRGGIRLVTPINVKDRRLYRIRWAAIGMLSYIVSIVAIELILKWNKVSGVYSIASTGQYVALIIGVGGFVSVSWTLVLQECRKRNLKRRQVANQDENGMELDSQSHNAVDAISHAFSRPDIGFSTNGGAFPIDSDEEGDLGIRSLNTPRPSPNIEAFMSGALDVQPDLEAQAPPPNNA